LPEQTRRLLQLAAADPSSTPPWRHRQEKTSQPSPHAMTAVALARLGEDSRPA
jgi:hypothetical protein